MSEKWDGDNEAKPGFGWFVANRDMENAIVRGPYRHAETAGAVRSELEIRFPNKDWNLWIVLLPIEEPEEPSRQ